MGVGKCKPPSSPSPSMSPSMRGWREAPGEGPGLISPRGHRNLRLMPLGKPDVGRASARRLRAHLGRRAPARRSKSRARCLMVEPNSSKGPPSSLKVGPSSSKGPPSSSKVGPSRLKGPPSSSKVGPSRLKVGPNSSKGPPNSSKVEPSRSKVEPSSLKVRRTDGSSREQIEARASS
jgi:hypothetical protein